MIELQSNRLGLWTAEVTLPEWSGFQSRRGPYGSMDRPGPSDGSLQVSFGPYGREKGPLSSQELQLIHWFGAHHARQGRAVVEAIFAALPLLHGAWQAEDGLSDPDKTFPEIRTPDDLRRFLGLHHVLIHQLDHGDQPYVGYVFGCDWDEGRGLGVLMHGTRAVEIGGSDTAFLMWIAERDAQRTL